MKPHVKMVVCVAAIGAACGIFFQFALLVFSVCQSSSSGENNGLNEIIIGINVPLNLFVEFTTRRHFMTSDNISMFLILYLIYGMVLGLVVALAGYFIKYLVKYLSLRLSFTRL